MNGMKHLELWNRTIQIQGTIQVPPHLLRGDLDEWNETLRTLEQNYTDPRHNSSTTSLASGGFR